MSSGRQAKMYASRTRNRLRVSLQQQGVPLAKIDDIIERMRLRQLAERAAARGEVLAEKLPAFDADAERRIDAFYEEERRRFDDSKHQPTNVDSVLKGVARATGATAVAVRRRKTLTQHEYRQREHG